MCASNAQPLNGADSARRYRVAVVDKHDPDDRSRWIELLAFGPRDIANQVAELDPHLLVLKEEAVLAPEPEFIDVGSAEGKNALLDAMLGRDAA